MAANPVEANPDIVGTIVEFVHEESYLFFVPVCKGDFNTRATVRFADLVPLL